MVECQNCEEFLCVDCVPHTNCASPHCTDIVCNDCLSKKCRECNKKWCLNCNDGCIECNVDGCNQICCVECSEKEGVNGVQWCDVCETKLCVECSENIRKRARQLQSQMECQQAEYSTLFIERIR